MPTFRSFSVSIQVDGKDLPEYQTEYHDKSKTATCWIPSEAGQRFTICCKQEKSFRYTISAQVYLDGNKKTVTRVLMGKQRSFSGQIKSVRTSPTARSPLQFTSLETTDNDNYLGLGLDLEAPGTVRVQMHRVIVTGQGNWEAGALPADKIVAHEKSKKAGGHLIGLGDPKSSRFNMTTNLTRPLTPGDRDPWVTFEFRYRSAAVLQAEGIVSGAMRPIRSKRERAALEAEFRELNAEEAALKAQIAELAAQSSNIPLKREPSPICVPESAVGETFDLTLDD